MTWARSQTGALVVVALACGGAVMHLLGQETPHGRLKGTLLTAERGTALVGIQVSLVCVGDVGRTYRTTTDGQGRFAFDHVPVGTYSLAAKTHAHEQPADLITIEESKTFSALFELEPTDPFLHTLLPQSVFSTQEEVQFRCHGFVPVNELRVAAYRVAPEVAVRAWSGSLSAGLTTRGLPLNRVDLDSVPELSAATRKRVGIKGRDLEGVFRQDLTLGKLEPGMYVVAIEAEDLREMRAVTVTDVGLIVKAAPDETVVFAANVKTGEPLRAVSLEVRSDDRPIATGTTDSRGLAAIPLPPETGERHLQLIGRHGRSFAVADWYDYRSREPHTHRIYAYTDRPVYRPGQKVYFKALVRGLEGDDYRVPAPLTARVRAMDDRDNLLYSAGHTTGEYGSLHGEFELSDNAIPGPCSLEVAVGSQVQRSSFSIAEYRKPEFEVTISTDAERYTRGETIEAVVEADYYYGAPVPDASVSYHVTRSPHWYAPARDEWDADLYEGYEEPEGEVITSGEGRTDRNGRLKVVVPTSVEAAEQSDSGYDHRFTVHAEVTDASRRLVAGSRSVLVTQGAFRLEVSAADWAVQPGEQVDVTVRAMDYDDQPLSDVRGELVLGQAEWDDDREKVTEEHRQSWVTDEGGSAQLTVTPRSSGDYRLVATARDTGGNAIKRSASLWVMGAGRAAFDYPYRDLDVRADRDLYHEGEIAQIVVRTRHAPRKALLTIESTGILDRRLIELKDKATVLELKVRPEFMPSAHAKVSFVRGKQLFSGDAIIHVSRETKALRVELTSDKPQYEPGTPAVYRVRASTPDGQPARAEISLALTDEAVYKIRPDRTPDILRYFYPKRPLDVETVFSFPEVYLDGDDKAGSQIRTRRLFPDTALWEPATITDANGEATFELTLPDSLTTWRATCRAATLDTHVGQATYKAVVRKPFSVRLQAPRFFTQEDRARLAAIVHNLTPSVTSATVGLEASGLELLDRAQKACRVPPGETKRVEWEVRPAGADACRARVWAESGPLSDAMELDLPVLPRGRKRQVTRSGAVTSDVDLRFEARADGIAGTQRLTIRLTPSTAAAMLGALEYLANYPYGCVEQTMSSFLPDVIIARLLRELGAENRALEAELPKMVEAGLVRLYEFERPEGGWGWWKHDQPDPWMTAYVVFGLVQAKAAGFRVDERVLGRGIAALQGPAQDPSGVTADTQAYVAYVLSVARRPDLAGQVARRVTEARRWGEGGRLSDWGKAMLALALARTGHGDEGRRLLSEVWRAFESRGSFGSSGTEWRSEGETASALLAAACKLTPDDPRLADLVRWLLERRRANRWHSTRDTAMALYALADYLLIGSELEPDMQATVKVNGRNIATRHFTAADVFQPEHEIVLTAGDLPGGDIAVKLERTGRGRLYYTALFEQFATGNLSAPVLSAPGLRVSRSYRTLDRRAEDRKPGDQAEPPAGSRFVCESGDVVEVTLTVRCEREFDHMMVEDMLPAGCEAQDRGRVSLWEWHYWWADRVVRDEQVAFAATRLARGANRLQYQMSAVIPGAYTALPPRVYDMYNPALRAEGVANAVVVRP